MIATIVDTGALAKMIYASLLAGVGVAAVFSLTIYGVTRSTEKRRAGQGGVAAAFAALALVALIASLAAVVYGVYLVAHKS
jgi:hypothetical protein